MRKLMMFALVFSLGGLLLSSSFAQNTDAARRAEELAAIFSKSKHVVKEKKGFRVEKFLEIRSVPAVKAQARDYAGTYKADSGYSFHLRVTGDGRLEAHGTEPGADATRSFTLRHAKLAGALLTGTKVYPDGATEPFEGLFIIRTERHSPTDAGTTSYGLGVYFDPPKTGESFTLSRLFYEMHQ